MTATLYSLPSMSNIKTVPRCVTRLSVLLMAEALSVNGVWNLHSREASSAAQPKEQAHAS